MAKIASSQLAGYRGETADGAGSPPPNRQSQLMEETLKSSEQGLRLSTIFSLLLSGFIILNTFLMNVSERRRQLSILRAIGATSGQIRRSLLGESLVLGVAGVVLGIGLGATIGRLLNRSLSSALDLQLPPAEVSGWAIAAAALRLGDGVDRRLYPSGYRWPRLAAGRDGPRLRRRRLRRFPQLYSRRLFARARPAAA
jgi:hypothetical protein